MNPLQQKVNKFFSRITSSNKLIKEIDGLRFFAIFWVILLHISGVFKNKSGLAFEDNPISMIANAGNNGVFLFFSISGFILYLPFLFRYKSGKKMNLKQYFLRRVSRIEPTYVIALIFYLLLEIVLNEYSFDLIKHFLASVFYMHNIIYGEPSTLVNAAWSLEVEIQFYLLMPIFTYLIFKFKNRFLAIAIATCLFAALQVQLENITEIRSLLKYMHYFLVGFLAAEIFASERSEIKLNKYVFDLVVVMSFLIIVVINFFGNVFLGDLIISICLFGVLMGAFHSKYFRKIVSNFWIVIIGGMCYTLYIFQKLILSVIYRVTMHLIVSDNYQLNLLIQIVIVSILVFIVGAFLFVLFERPFMRKEWYKFKKQKN